MHMLNIGKENNMSKNSATSSNMAQRRWNFSMPETGNKEYDNMSIFQRVRYDMEEKRKRGETSNIAFKVMTFIMIFHSPTELFSFTHYITPYMLEDFSPWTRYYFNVFIWFIVMNMIVNWLCVMLYDPSITKTKDNPFLQLNDRDDSPPDQFVAKIQEAANQKSGNGSNGYCVYDMTSKEAMPLEYCEKCQMHIPFRAHHCDICKKCILKRDHHCYMIGTCIGFKNQRYFIILSFYVFFNALFTGVFNFLYLKNAVWPVLESPFELFFPYAIWRCIFGNVKLIHCIVIIHVYIHVIFGALGFMYFNSQMTITAGGKTLYEVAKKVPIKNSNSMNRNFKSVFGDYWALNFLFPMTLVLPQRDDGIFWEGVKLDHNANEKQTVNGHSVHSNSKQAV